MFASVLVLPVALCSLIFPEYARTMFYGRIPMAITETVVGFWLMIVAIRSVRAAVGEVPTT